MLGWVGSIAFAVCGLPLVISCVRQGHARDVNNAFLILWSIGEVCYIIQVIADFGFVMWLLFNYLMNAAFIVVILYFKVKDHGNRN